MKTVLPKRAQFFLSDDIREEANGKMTIVGYYADGKIFVTSIPNTPALPPGQVTFMPQFCMTCILAEGEGALPVTLEIRGPSNQVIANYSAQQQFAAGATTTVALKGSNITFPEFGRYNCIIKVKSKKFTGSFEVLKGPAPGQSATANIAAANRL
jgi:hypothetical protein